MQKTTNYNLNKPEVTDPLRVADFNENADIIDATLNSLNTAVGTKAEQSAVNTVAQSVSNLIVTGTYAGTANSGAQDTSTQTIELGFQPRFLLIRNINYKGSASVGDDWTPSYLAFAAPEYPHYVRETNIVVSITSSGFSVGGYGSYFNAKGITYHFVAIR